MAGPSSVPLIRYDLASYGVVTQVVSAIIFRVAGLAGQGDGAFAGYDVYVLKKADGSITPPHAEQADCTAYVSSSGQFTHAAFTANLAVGDAVLLLHPSVGALTAARAGYLDRIKNLTRPQEGTQATTAALAVVGAAIEAAVPFKVVGYLSLDLMQAGDDFLVIEEIRDQDDATYREYGRHTYSGVQESPMVWFEEKVCRGWRVQIQRTAGADRNVTYQFFGEVSSA